MSSPITCEATCRCKWLHNEAGISLFLIRMLFYNSLRASEQQQIDQNGYRSILFQDRATERQFVKRPPSGNAEISRVFGSGLGRICLVRGMGQNDAASGKLCRGGVRGKKTQTRRDKACPGGGRAFWPRWSTRYRGRGCWSGWSRSIRKVNAAGRRSRWNACCGCILCSSDTGWPTKRSRTRCTTARRCAALPGSSKATAIRPLPDT